MRAFRKFGFAIAAATLAGTSFAAAQDAIVKPGYAVVTGYAGFVEGQPPEGADPVDYRTINPEGISAEVDDLTSLGPQGTLSSVPKPFTLTATQVGQVFGVTLDRAKAPNIYLAATSAYGLSIYTPDDTGALKRTERGTSGAQFVPGQFGPPELGGGPGSVYRVDGTTGEVTLLVNIDGGVRSVAALGGLTFDPVTSQLFVSERGTGLIYRLGLDGTINGTYDHGVEGRPAASLPPVSLVPPPPADIENPAFDTSNPATWGVASPARRIFGLGVYNRRLYYAVAQGPQIWSAAINPTGTISGARFEVEVPSLADGVEIASITFDGAGRMYLAERGATTGDYTLMALANEAQSRVLRYVPKPVGDPSPGRWRLAPDVYSIGLPPAYANADGGVALNYGYAPNGKINLQACGATLWSTGERLLDPGDGTEGFPTAEGLQGNSVNLFQPQNMPPTQSWFVDYDDQAGDPLLRGTLGAIATIPCAGTPLICPKGTQNQNGACVYPPCLGNQTRVGANCVPPPPACKLPRVRQQDGSCDCPNPNDVVARDGKRCVPPQKPCDLRTNDVVNGKCVPQCPGDWVRTGKNGKCEPPKKPCDARTNDFYNGQCLPKCPRGEQHTGKNGVCLPPPPKCPNGIGPGCLPPAVFCNLQTHEFVGNVCVPRCKSPSVRLPNGKCSIVFNPNGPVLVNPPLLALPLKCDPGEEVYKGACTAKCLSPEVRLSNGSCGLRLQGPILQLPGFQLQQKP